MRSSDGRAASAAEKVILDGQNLTLEQVVRVAREGVAAEIAPEALARVEESRRLVEAFLRGGKAVYGVTTGFGKFSDVMISPEETEYLQRNLIVSHACGVGEPLDPEIVRAVMLLRANALCKGFSGIRRDTLETLVAMLNRGVHPIIPEKGSLGASGDLAPLAHMVLVLIGEGEAWYEGERLPGGEAMRRSGIPPVTLQAKEGLALINGTVPPISTRTGCFWYSAWRRLTRTLSPGSSRYIRSSCSMIPFS
ncbi:MAG: aromatic amino acid lyase, partial [Actinobacteria bacterium]|nr:aromatic amino acid lyase [Actinomycetota bacterium]